MLMRINSLFILLSCLSFATKASITISGSIEYALDAQKKQILTIYKTIDANTFETYLSTLMESNAWIIENIDPTHAKIMYNAPEQRAIYDFGFSDSGAVFDATITSTTYGNGNVVLSIDFHPSGKYLLVAGEQSAGVNAQIFAISETGSALYVLPECNQLHGGTIHSAKWSPDGMYYAIAGTATQNLTNNTGTVTFNTSIRLYQFDAINKKSTLLPFAQADHGTTVTAIDWHPSGKYLALAGNQGNGNYHLRICSFNGSLLTILPHCNFNLSDLTLGNPHDLHWHPSGNYLTISTDGSAPHTRTFYFKKDHLIEVQSTRLTNGTGHIKWNPLGTHLAITYSTNTSIYAFNDTKNFSLVATVTRAGGTDTEEGIAWSPDGAYLSVTRSNDTSGFYASTYQFIDNTITDITNAQSAHGETLFTTAWSPDGSLVAYGGNTASGLNIRMYQFTQNSSELIRKNYGMLLQINNLINQSYQDYLETETLIYTTSAAALTANPLYISETVSYNSGIQFTNVPWDNLNNPSSTLNPIYHEWHPGGKYLAIAEGSDTSGDNFLHIFSKDSTDTIKPVSSLFFPTQSGSDARPLSLSWSPNGKYLAVQVGPTNRTESITKLYSFDGSSLALTLTSQFFSQYAPAWAPNGSFLLTTTPSNIFTLLSFNGQYTSTHQSGFPIPPTSSIGRAEWTNDGKAFFAWNSGTGAVGGYFYDFTSETGSAVQLTSAGISSTKINAIAIRPNTTVDDESYYIAIGFNEESPNLRIYEFNGVSQPTPSLSILPGCSLNERTSVIKLAWSSDGLHLAVVWGDSPQYLQVYRFVDNVWLSPVGFVESSFVTTTGSLGWSLDNQLITQAPAGIDEGPFVLRTHNIQHLSLLISTSNVVESATNEIIDTTLLYQNSHALVTYRPLAIANSDAWNTYHALNIETSNALSTHLIGMSNAVAGLTVANSYAIVSLSALNITNSNAITTNQPLNIANSQVLTTYRPIIIGNSDAIVGTLVGTSNAATGLLIHTSNALETYLIATSQAEVTNATKALRLDTIDTGPAHIHYNATNITMTYDIFISSDHKLLIHQSGIINGNGHSIYFPTGNETACSIDSGITTTLENVYLRNFNDATLSLAPNASLIFGNNCIVELQKPTTLSRTWSFAGNTTLQGNQHALTLNQNQEYLAALPQTILTIENVILNKVGFNNIRCLNNNTAITFKEKCSLALETDFTFSTGSILINGELLISGTTPFNYTSKMGLTIDSQSKLFFDHNTIFHYAPSANFRTLLSLTDSTAQLIFNNATLIATTTGPQITKGHLIINGMLNIQSSATSAAEALVFGDGNPANDLIITLMPASGITLLSGYLNYANAN